MSTFTIPNSQGQIRQDGHSDTAGELWETFNIDLNDTRGKIKVANKLTKILDKTNDLGGDRVQDIAIYLNFYYVATETNVYWCPVTSNPTISTNWSIVSAISGSLGFETTMTVFGGLLLISLRNDIGSWNGSSFVSNWWTSTVSGAALTANYQHTLHVHRGGQETLVVTDKNLIRYYNSTAGHSTITLQPDSVACSLSSGISAVWAGTYTATNTNAFVYEFYIGEVIGPTSVARNAYKINARSVLAIEVINNVPVIITEKGRIQRFNGAGFTTIASFPFAFKNTVLTGVVPGNVQSSGNFRPVHPRGMVSEGDSVYINIYTELATGDVPVRSNSGIWEYSEITGQLTHKHAFCETTTEYGFKQSATSGAILVLNNQYTFLLCGGGGGVLGGGMFATTSDTNMGFFVTPEIESGTISDIYENVYLKAKTLGASESIELKYRYTDINPEYLDVTWIDATTCTTTDTPVTTMVGYEATIASGYNAGHIAHITNISQSVNTATITLDTAIGLPGESCRIYVLNFVRVKNTYLTEQGEISKLGIGITSPWIQYKVVMTGAVELRQFISKGNSKAGL